MGMHRSPVHSGLAPWLASSLETHQRINHTVGRRGSKPRPEQAPLLAAYPVTPWVALSLPGQRAGTWGPTILGLKACAQSIISVTSDCCGQVIAEGEQVEVSLPQDPFWQ